MSTVIQVVCPYCGKGLKLKDRSKLGKTGKCPSCAKPFKLEESTEPEEEIPLTLADDAPQVGTGARWIPDAAPAAAGPIVTNAPRPGAPVINTAGAGIPGGGGAPLVNTGGADGGLERLKEIRRRGAKRRNMAILFGGLTALVIGGIVWLVQSKNTGDAVATGQSAAVNGTAGTAPAATTSAAVGPGPAPAAMGATLPSVMQGDSASDVRIPYQTLLRSQLEENKQTVSVLLPQRGEPILLKMVPSGVNVVIHLRPALLWSDDPTWTAFRYSLTEDVTNWIAAKLKEVCRRDPQQIEECLICVRLGATGTEPEVATVVRLAQEEKLSDLIEEFRGANFNEDGGPRIKIASPYAYLIRDTQTIAIAPERDAFEFQEYLNTSNPNVTEGLYRLLDLTDDQRVFTVLFEIDDVKRHEAWFFSERTLPVFRKVLDWFGDDVETVGWSVDVTADSASSDILLRTRAVANPMRLADDSLQRLEFLPQDLMLACQKMYPATQGFQQIIGRFPAMMEVYRQATVPTVGDRHVRLTTVLPAKAAPNLALGTLLTWDQSTHTDFSTKAPTTTVAAAAPAENLPATVEGRMQQTFDAELIGPFQNVIAYISEEMQVPIEIDGNALKDAGFTKNMPQKYELGKVTGLEALRAIFEGNRPPVPEKRLCLVIDEANMSALISTEAFAAAAGQTVYPVVPAE
ncbi:MAG: hypothetical protein R3B90_09910 [Planctomycetaceae bacterium]